MRHVVGALTVAAAGLVCACSQKDSPKPDSAKVAQSGAATSAPSGPPAGYDVATHTATVHAKDFAFDAPDSIPGGWTTFHFLNDGPALHHVQLVRLDSGKTVADLAAALNQPNAPPPRWAVFVGGPNAPDPKSQSEAVLNLQPGHYAMLCLVDIPDHVPHFAKGMMRAFNVTAPAAGAAATEPSADVTISFADYAFTPSGTLAAGKHTFKVENKGPQPHEVEIVRFAPGKNTKDLAAWVDKPNGPPPANALGGISAIVPGTTAYFTADLTPGDYAMLCFIPDMKDGKPHLMHGMVKEFKIN